MDACPESICTCLGHTCPTTVSLLSQHKQVQQALDAHHLKQVLVLA